jgi:hypothetical protein
MMHAMMGRGYYYWNKSEGRGGFYSWYLILSFFGLIRKALLGLESDLMFFPFLSSVCSMNRCVKVTGNLASRADLESCVDMKANYESYRWRHNDITLDA